MNPIAHICREGSYQNIPRHQIAKNKKSHSKRAAALVRSENNWVIPAAISIILLSNLQVTTGRSLLGSQGTSLAKTSGEDRITAVNYSMVYPMERVGREKRESVYLGNGWTARRRNKNTLLKLIRILTAVGARALDNAHCKEFLKTINLFNEDLRKPFSELNQLVGDSIKQVDKQFKNYTDTQKEEIIEKFNRASNLSETAYVKIDENQEDIKDVLEEQNKAILDLIEITDSSFTELQDIKNRSEEHQERLNTELKDASNRLNASIGDFQETSLKRMDEMEESLLVEMKNSSLQEFEKAKAQAKERATSAKFGRAVFGTLGLAVGIACAGLQIGCTRMTAKGPKKNTKRSKALLEEMALMIKEGKASVELLKDPSLEKATQTQEDPTEDEETDPLLNTEFVYRKKYSQKELDAFLFKARS